MYVCVRACVRACVHVCACVCASTCMLGMTSRPWIRRYGGEKTAASLGQGGLYLVTLGCTSFDRGREPFLYANPQGDLLTTQQQTIA